MNIFRRSMNNDYGMNELDFSMNYRYQVNVLRKIYHDNFQARVSAEVARVTQSHLL